MNLILHAHSRPPSAGLMPVDSVSRPESAGCPERGQRREPTARTRSARTCTARTGGATARRDLSGANSSGATCTAHSGAHLRDA